MAKRKSKSGKKRDRVSIKAALEQLEADLRGGARVKGETTRDGDIARGMSVPRTTYSEFKRPLDPKTPSFAQAISVAHYFRVPLDTLPDPQTPQLFWERDGIAWRPSGAAGGVRERAMQLAAAGVLEGQPLGIIQGWIRNLRDARGKPEDQLDEDRVRDMAQGALVFGLVEMALSANAREIVDANLADELSQALGEVAPGGQAPQVHVVRNVAHADFSHDPVGPFLVALVAHRVVARFLAEKTVYQIGLAGGVHCSLFVRAISGASSPFPDPFGDKRITFVPLTLEPFRDHGLPLADAVVGQMVSAAGSLLGPRRVTAPTLKPFGYVVDDAVDKLDTDSIGMVREEYGKLDVAIYGCGDMYHDGWLRRILQRVQVDKTLKPATDVCLSLLSALGEHIPLPLGRQFVGLSLENIRRMTESPSKLALLLTSGKIKGLPLTAVCRAGCASTVICDQAAARSALEELARSKPRPRAPSRGSAAPATDVRQSDS